jgi:hypothetical protein
LDANNIILGEDLNFTIGASQVWGTNESVDPLGGLFSHLFMERGLIDLAPTQLKHTWRNKQSGDDRIEKRIDRFLVSKDLLMAPINLGKWVDNGGDSYHFPIVFEVAGLGRKPASPFKFNS